MKKSLILVIIIFVVGLLFFLTRDGSTNTVLGENVTLTLYTSEGVSNGNAAISIPFTKTRSGAHLATASIDFDGSGTFEENETVASNVPVVPQKKWNNKLYFAVPEDFTGAKKVKITLGDDTFEGNIVVEEFDVGRLLDLGSVTNPEESMKGFGTAVAYAEGATLEITQENVPDISQQPGECAPTSAVNSLISLIGSNGKPADLPGTPGEMIEDLKGEMKWTRTNGVAPDDFVSGKNAWALKHGLPIHTTKVGDVHGITTLDPIREALQNGDAVELRIKFAGADGKIAGGHMVTVTGIHEADGQTYIDINDPATGEGTETVEIRSNQITNYGPWEGITVMSWGFIQSWGLDESKTSETSTSVDSPETENRVGVDVEKVKPVAVEMAFAHVKPGEYSEVYAVVMTTPGNEVEAKLTGPDVEFKGTRAVVADENGQARFVWKIFQYGSYTASGSVEGGADFTGIVNVN